MQRHSSGLTSEDTEQMNVDVDVDVIVDGQRDDSCLAVDVANKSIL